MQDGSGSLGSRVVMQCNAGGAQIRAHINNWVAAGKLLSLRQGGGVGGCYACIGMRANECATERDIVLQHMYTVMEQWSVYSVESRPGVSASVIPHLSKPGLIAGGVLRAGEIG